MPSIHLICRPLLLLPPIPPSIKVFSTESTLCTRWPKYCSVSFSFSPSNENPRLISFRMYWLDILTVQVTLKSLFQHHSSEASILLHSAFFTVQLSHPYMMIGKTIALTRQTFVGKVMSLLFNMLSRLVITFLPRSKCLLISWLQSPSALANFISYGSWLISIEIGVKQNIVKDKQNHMLIEGLIPQESLSSIQSIICPTSSRSKYWQNKNDNRKLHSHNRIF